MWWRVVTLIVGSGCATVARTHAGIADGGQAQVSTSLYVLEESDDGEWSRGWNAQVDMGWGKRLAANSGAYAGVKAVFPWISMSQLDLYVLGPSTGHVLWGVGVEGNVYFGGPYAALTFDVGSGGYLTLTGRIQSALDSWAPYYGGQLAIGLTSLVLFAGYLHDREANALLIGGIGFVPDWELRRAASPDATGR